MVPSIIACVLGRALLSKGRLILPRINLGPVLVLLLSSWIFFGTDYDSVSSPMQKRGFEGYRRFGALSRISRLFRFLDR